MCLGERIMQDKIRQTRGRQGENKKPGKSGAGVPMKLVLSIQIFLIPFFIHKL